jgi:hypothetical protein
MFIVEFIMACDGQEHVNFRYFEELMSKMWMPE